MAYGWYSEKQAELGGVYVYARADGTLVKVTHVTSSNKTETKFDDLVSVGEVHHWVRTDTESKLKILRKTF